MIRFLLAVAVLGAAPAIAGAQDLTGDWQGTLAAGGAELRLILHVSKAADGTVSATMDSIDQGAKGIPIQVHQDGSKVNLESTDIHATYDGTLSADGKTLKGTWSQGQPVPLELTKTDHPWTLDVTPADPSDIDGRWEGKLDFGSAILRIVFRFTNTKSGLTGTVQSPDQSPNEAPMTGIQRKDTELSLQMKQFAAEFTGKIASDHKTIAGTFIQNGKSTPLTVTRAKE